MVQLFQAVPLLEVLEYSYNYNRHVEMVYPLDYSAPLPEVRMNHLKQLVLQSFWREDVTIYSVLRAPSHMKTSISSRAAHESLIDSSGLAIEDYLNSHLLRFGNGVLMLMDAYRTRHEDPSSHHEPLLLISFHADNLGVSLRVGTEGDLPTDNKFSSAEACDGPQPLRLDVSLPADMKTGDHTRKRFSTLVRAVAAVPYQPHILHFDGNLPTFDTTLFLKLSKCTVALVLGQLCDVEALVTLLHNVPPPAFSRLLFVEVIANLPEPEAAFQVRQLADALEDAYLAKEQLLGERFRLYYRGHSGELLMLHFQGAGEGVKQE